RNAADLRHSQSSLYLQVEWRLFLKDTPVSGQYSSFSSNKEEPMIFFTAEIRLQGGRAATPSSSPH
ncbi:MAG: hypothetical protein K6F46_03440, partial [Desulfovibrio sp.]|nr:hypothetical protein [Desulfovibrio sp.]